MWIKVGYWRSMRGRIHRQVHLEGGPRMTAEGCNRDQAQADETWDEEEMLAWREAGSEFCPVCFSDRVYADPAEGS